MKGEYIPESGPFLEDIMELQKRDKEAYDSWEGKRNCSLKRDHP